MDQRLTNDQMIRIAPSYTFSILMLFLLVVPALGFPFTREFHGESCDYELEILSEVEKERVIAWSDQLFGEDQYTVGFSCRITSDQIGLAIRPASAPKAQLYLLALEDLRRDVLPLSFPEVEGPDEGVPLSILMDKVQQPHLLERGGGTQRGVMRLRYTLTNLKTQKQQFLAESQADGESGGCNRHEFLKLDRARYIEIETKDLNGDGLKDIEMTIREEICGTGRVLKAVRKRLYANSKGFTELAR